MYCHLASETKVFQLPSTTQTEINNNWQNFIAWRETKENATLCRLVKIEGDALFIANDVSYKDVVGLRWQKSITAEKAPFQVVTALALVHTSDGYLVLIPRDSGDWEYSLECPGGFLRKTHLEDGQASVTDFIKKRVGNDMKLQRNQIDSCTYTTTHDAREILEHMLVYDLTLTLNKEELQELHPTFVIVPPEHTPDTHHKFTPEPLHGPSRGALQAAAHQQITSTLITQQIN